MMRASALYFFSIAYVMVMIGHLFSGVRGTQNAERSIKLLMYVPIPIRILAALVGRRPVGLLRIRQ
jgi:hypothetical protein